MRLKELGQRRGMATRRVKWKPKPGHDRSTASVMAFAEVARLSWMAMCLDWVREPLKRQVLGSAVTPPVPNWSLPSVDVRPRQCAPRSSPQQPVRSPANGPWNHGKTPKHSDATPARPPPRFANLHLQAGSLNRSSSPSPSNEPSQSKVDLTELPATKAKSYAECRLRACLPGPAKRSINEVNCLPTKNAMSLRPAHPNAYAHHIRVYSSNNADGFFLSHSLHLRQTCCPQSCPKGAPPCP